MAASEVLIATATCQDGWGWFGLARFPSRRVFRSADDRYIVLVTIKNANGTVEFASYQTTGTGFGSWGSKDSIWAPSDGTINDASIDGWLDANDNLYVCMTNRTVTGRTRFVKYTKTSTTWTKGTVYTIQDASSQAPFNMQIAKNEVTGRVWTIANKLNYNIHVFYSDDDGVTWNQGVGMALGDSHYQNQPAICCYDKYVLTAFREAGTNKLFVSVHDDTQAVGVGWTPTQMGTSATGVNDGEMFVLLPVGKSGCSVLYLAAYTDGTTKRARWTSGVGGGWGALTTTFTETTDGLHNRSMLEGAVVGKVILWNKANAAYEYDPTADTLTLKSDYGHPSPTVTRKGADGLWFSARSTSTGTTMSLYFRYEQYAQAGSNFDRVTPVHARAEKNPSLILPVHSRRLLPADRNIPVCALIDNSVGASFAMPVHAVAERNFDRVVPVASKEYRFALSADRVVPVQARASRNFDRTVGVQARATGVWTKENEGADDWSKEASGADDWTKETPPVDSWGKA